MLGNIVERSNGNPAPPSVPSSRTASTSGFPTIVHRSQKPKRPSAFAAASARQARDTGYGKAVDYSDIPHVGDKSSLQPSSSQAGPSKPRIIDGEENEYSRIQRDVGDENLQRIAGMTMEEREEEIGELEERFGSSVMEALRKRAEKRARGGNDNQELNQEGSNTNEGECRANNPCPARVLLLILQATMSHPNRHRSYPTGHRHRRRQGLVGNPSVLIQQLSLPRRPKPI